MKKILIISYHSLPYDLIASYRANAYLKHFKSFGLEPTLLTHFMGMKEHSNASVEEFEYGNVIRVPIKKSRLGIITGFIEKFALINRLSIFLRWMLGYLDARPEDIDSYFSLKSFCFSDLNIYQFDVVLGIFSPHHHLRLCYKLHKKFKIPYVLDFRDLWDNRIMKESYSPTFIEGLQDLITKNYWSRWLNSAIFFTATSEPWKLKTETITKTTGYVITNGFDAEEFHDNVKSEEEEFCVVHAGSLYQHQELNTFLEGVERFLNIVKPNNMKVKFIGANRSGGLKNKSVSLMNNPIEIIRQYLPQSICDISPRMTKRDTIVEMEKSQILLFFGHSSIKGWYSGKIFDYLGAKRNILLVPNDNGVVGDMIRKTKSGHAANTSEEVFLSLKKYYCEWKEKGYINYYGNHEVIKMYSRELQTRTLANLINKAFREN